MQLDHKVICRFRFICTERWEGLIPVAGDSKKRFCAVCETPVYLTNSYEELETNIAAKRCVAIFLASKEGPSLEFMGDVQPAAPGCEISQEPIFTRPIEELELSGAASDVLRVNDVKLFGDLVICTKTLLVEQFRITDNQMEEILEALACRGLTIGMRLDNWELVSAKYR